MAKKDEQDVSNLPLPSGLCQGLGLKGMVYNCKQWLACVIGCGDLFFGSFLCFLLMMMWYIMTDILA